MRLLSGLIIIYFLLKVSSFGYISMLVGVSGARACLLLVVVVRMV